MKATAAKSQNKFFFQIFIAFFLVIGLFSGTTWAEKIPEETQQKLKGLRIPFIVNQGQVDREVRFYAKTFSGTVYVTDQGKMVYQLPLF